MLTGPELVERVPVFYAFIAFSVPMKKIPAVAPDGFARLFDLLDEAGVEPAGPAFMNYRRIDMTNSVDFEIGVAVGELKDQASGLNFGVLPGGAYGRLLWTGPYDKLVDANSALTDWALKRGIKWDARPVPGGEAFACRLEIYEAGPMDHPDPQKWRTEIAIKIAPVDKGPDLPDRAATCPHGIILVLFGAIARGGRSSQH